MPPPKRPKLHLPYRHWPTHWAGGNDRRRIDGENVVWIDSDDGTRIAHLNPKYFGSRDDGSAIERTTNDQVQIGAFITSACNACHAIDADNPMKVAKWLQANAEKVKALYKNDTKATNP